MKRDDVCCPTCKAPRVNTDGTYNIKVIGGDRNGSTRFKCKRCPDAASFVLQQPADAASAKKAKAGAKAGAAALPADTPSSSSIQQPHHAASAKKAKAGAAALPADTPPEAAAGGSGARPSAHAAGSAAPVKHEEVKREDVCCPTCTAPRVNADGTYNIKVVSGDRNGSTQYKCKHCGRCALAWPSWEVRVGLRQRCHCRCVVDEVEDPPSRQ